MHASSAFVVVVACTCAVDVAGPWHVAVGGSSVASSIVAAASAPVAPVLEQDVIEHEHLGVDPYRAASRPSLALPDSLAERVDLIHRA